MQSPPQFEANRFVDPDRRRVARQYSKKGRLAAFVDRPGNSCHQGRSISPSAIIRMRADRAYLNEPRHPCPLARHRHQTSGLENAEKLTQFMRPRAKRPRLRQFSQFHHRRDIGSRQQYSGFSGAIRSIRELLREWNTRLDKNQAAV